MSVANGKCANTFSYWFLILKHEIMCWNINSERKLSKTPILSRVKYPEFTFHCIPAKSSFSKSSSNPSSFNPPQIYPVIPSSTIKEKKMHCQKLGQLGLSWIPPPCIFLIGQSDVAIYKSIDQIIALPPPTELLKRDLLWFKDLFFTCSVMFANSYSRANISFLTGCPFNAGDGCKDVPLKLFLMSDLYHVI